MTSVLTHANTSRWPWWVALVGALVVSAWLAGEANWFAVRATVAGDTITPDGGFAWHVESIPVSRLVPHWSDDGEALASRLVLLENGRPLGPAHCEHDAIRSDGRGAFSHWRGELWFATSDNSDPRRNGRVYTIEVPAHFTRGWLWSGGALLGIAIAALLRRALVRVSDRERSLLTWSGYASLAVAAFGTAAIARLRLAPCQVEQPLPPGAILELPPAEDGWPAVRRFEVDLFGGGIRWHFPPFCIGDWQTAEHAGAITLVVDGHQVPRCADPATAGDAACLRLVNGQMLVVQLAPDATVANWTLGVPIVPSRGAVLLVAWAALTGVWLLRHRRRTATRSPEHAVLRVLQLAPVPTALGLLAANLIGVVGQPLRVPLELTNDDASFGASDRTSSWDEVQRDLPRQAGEADADYVRRLTHVVASGVAHVWDRRRASELAMQVPLTENWPLWLGGELVPGLREYFFVDAHRMVQRGVGMCGHVAYAIAELLVDAGCDARVAELGGHTVTTVAVDGAWWIADADYDLVLPLSLDEAGARLPEVTVAYENVLRGYGRDCVEATAARIAATFTADGNRIGASRPSAELSGLHRAGEALAYRLVWWLPIASLLPWLFGLLRRR